jgi:predicted amidophosphoribosyltransferase
LSKYNVPRIESQWKKTDDGYVLTKCCQGTSNLPLSDNPDLCMIKLSEHALRHHNCSDKPGIWQTAFMFEDYGYSV